MEKCKDLSSLDFFEDCLIDNVASTDDVCQSGASCIARGKSGKVFFKHLRKSGGTAFRITMATRICDKYVRPSPSSRPQSEVPACSREVDVSAWTDEMSILHEDSAVLNGRIAAHAEGASLLLATSLREPLARILSSFHFEGNPQLNSKSKTKPTKELCTGGCDLRGWVDYISSCHCTVNLWNAVSNYYVRVFSGTPCGPTNGDTVIADEHYRQAVFRMASMFDLVFISEWSRNESSKPLYRALLPPLNCNGTADSSEPLKLMNANENTKKDETFAPTTIEALKIHDPAIVEDLVVKNSWDLRLYDFAKRLHKAQIQVWTRSFYRVNECRKPCFNTNGKKLGLPLPPAWSQENGPIDFGCSRVYSHAARYARVGS